MAAELIEGQTAWECNRDEEGHREYKIKFLIKCDKLDGPNIALQCEGLPKTGDTWAFDNDIDDWAYCKETTSVKPVADKEGNEFFVVEKTFSSKPDDARCKQEEIEDPLLVPQEVSGGFQRYNEEATRDRFGKPILNSAFEPFTGPQVEFDGNRATVKIGQNVPLLELELFMPMLNTLNKYELWGLPPRCIMLANASWVRKYQGNCQVYYRRDFDFDVNVKVDPDTGDLTSGFDRDLLDEGTKALHGENKGGNWVLTNVAAGTPPDPLNPAHYVRYKDANGENSKCILDGAGKPISVQGVSTAIKVVVASAGSGYSIGDRVTLAGGTFTTATEVTVAMTGTGGTVVKVVITVPGKYTVVPTNPVAQGSTSTGGLGATFTVTWNTTAPTAGKIHVEKYDESDFLLLDIPTEF